MVGVRMLRITAWTLLIFGTVWWLVLTFLATVYGASGAGWVFLGGPAVLSLPIGILRLLHVPTGSRVVYAVIVTTGVGVGMVLWSDLDEVVSDSREYGWIVIGIALASSGFAWIDRSALGSGPPDSGANR